jgi:hypothetical protein
VHAEPVGDSDRPTPDPLGHEQCADRPPDGLTRWEVTTAKALAEAGYATGMWGKCHLGSDPENRSPVDFGFDEAVWSPRTADEVLWTMQSYFPNGTVTATPYAGETRIPLEPEPIYARKKGAAHEVIATYDAEFRAGFDRMITSWAIDFMRRSRQQGKPFRLCLPYTQTHIPTIPDPEYAGKTKRGNWADILTQMDDFTGQILDELDVLGRPTTRAPPSRRPAGRRREVAPARAQTRPSRGRVSAARRQAQPSDERRGARPKRRLVPAHLSRRGPPLRIFLGIRRISDRPLSANDGAPLNWLVVPPGVSDYQADDEHNSGDDCDGDHEQYSPTCETHDVSFRVGELRTWRGPRAQNLVTPLAPPVPRPSSRDGGRTGRRGCGRGPRPPRPRTPIGCGAGSPPGPCPATPPWASGAIRTLVPDGVADL